MENEKLAARLAVLERNLVLAREAVERLERLAAGKEGRKPQVALGWIRECCKDIKAALNSTAPAAQDTADLLERIAVAAQSAEGGCSNVPYREGTCTCAGCRALDLTNKNWRQR